MFTFVVSKLQERRPLKYFIARDTSRFSPVVISGEPKVCKIQFSALLDKLFSSKWVSKKIANVVKLSVCKEQLSKFKIFEVNGQRIDKVLGGYLHNSQKF